VTGQPAVPNEPKLVHCPSCGHDAVPIGHGPEPTLCADCHHMLVGLPGAAPRATPSAENPSWGIPESALLWLASYFAMLSSAVIAIVGFVFVAGWFEATIPGGEDIMRHPPALVAGVLSSAVGHAITLLLAWVVVTDGGRQPFLEAIGWGWRNGIGMRHVLATFGLVYAVTIAIGVLVQEPDTPFKQMLETSYGVRIAVGVVAVLTAPIAEEVVYRGVLYPAFARRFGAIAGVVLVSGIFLLVHAEQYASAPAIMLPLGLLSVALTTLRAVSGSIMPSVVLHLLFNGVQVALLLFVPDSPAAPAPE
jgi:membrane protease YdiL (CAAX protease family)